MAARDRPAKGFFRALNVVSTADAEFLQPSSVSVKRKRSSGQLWEVERLVQKRERNGAVSCLRVLNLIPLYFARVSWASV